jgi:hypothetical protein
MAEARVAVAADTDGICALLHDRMSAEIPVRDWRRLMTYDWLPAKPDLGGVIEEEGRIVGYMGVIYAERRRNRRSFTTGNLTSWYVERPYREGGLALGLLRICTRRRDVVYTSFTSTSKALPLLRLAGLRPLDAARYAWRRGAGRPAGDITVVSGAKAVAPLLGVIERRLVADHAALAVHPCLLRADAGDCLVMLSVHAKTEAPARFDALYIGAPDILAANAQAFADAILPSGEAELTVDRRFLGDGASGGELQEIRVPRCYRPIEGLEPADIDILYSEIELLDLKLW